MHAVFWERMENAEANVLIRADGWCGARLPNGPKMCGSNRRTRSEHKASENNNDSFHRTREETPNSELDESVSHLKAKSFRLFRGASEGFMGKEER